MSINQKVESIIKTKLPKKLTSIQKETAIIHIANSLLSMGMSIEKYEDTLIKDSDSQHTKNLKNLLKDLVKKSDLFGKELNKNTKLANEIFLKIQDDIKREIKNPKPSSMFKKTCRLNSDGDIEANATLLSVLLITQQKHILNKKIFLQYKLAEDVILNLVNEKTKIYENARIISKRYVNELDKWGIK